MWGGVIEHPVHHQQSNCTQTKVLIPPIFDEHRGRVERPVDHPTRVQERHPLGRLRQHRQALGVALDRVGSKHGRVDPRGNRNGRIDRDDEREAAGV